MCSVLFTVSEIISVIRGSDRRNGLKESHWFLCNQWFYSPLTLAIWDRDWTSAHRLGCFLTHCLNGHMIMHVIVNVWINIQMAQFYTTKSINFKKLIVVVFYTFTSIFYLNEWKHIAHSSQRDVSHVLWWVSGVEGNTTVEVTKCFEDRKHLWRWRSHNPRDESIITVIVTVVMVTSTESLSTSQLLISSVWEHVLSHACVKVCVHNKSSSLSANSLSLSHHSFFCSGAFI